MRDIAVLLSGGVDSMLVLKMALETGRRVHAWFFDYGQPAAAFERREAFNFATACGVESFRAERIRLDGSMAIGAGAEGPRVLPGRNEALIRAVISRTIPGTIDDVWIGAIADDAADYEDCRQEFVDKLNASLHRSLKCRVTVVAPIIQLQKSEVVRNAIVRRIDLRKAWACYEPIDGQPCQTCNSCVSFRRGVAANSGV